MNEIKDPRILLKNRLNRDDYDRINALQLLCTQYDGVTLKLELDYKLSDAENSPEAVDLPNIHEFLYFNGDELIGYIGICAFGGSSAPLEITGMVHPEYRRQGVFSRLHELIADECRRRNPCGVLFLCDRESASGRKFLDKIGALYTYSEYEMYLAGKSGVITEESRPFVTLRKASNHDAGEVARQNSIYFGDRAEQEAKDTPDEKILFPEEEEKRGMTIYITEAGEKIVGKVHLQTANGTGGIYGLGVLPEFRGLGYGRAILMTAIGKLKAAGLKQIMLQVAAENERALRLYQSCGFEETSVMDYFE